MSRFGLFFKSLPVGGVLGAATAFLKQEPSEKPAMWVKSASQKKGPSDHEEQVVRILAQTVTS